MTYYNQLRTLLCEVEEIKKDLKELRFGCIIKYNNNELVKNGKIIFKMGKDFYHTDGFDDIDKNDIIKIIGNDIEERHIRMYLKKYNSYYDIKDDLLRLWACSTNNISGGEFCNSIKSIKYNINEPFHQQDEEVYRQLVEYFNNIK